MRGRAAEFVAQMAGLIQPSPKAQAIDFALLVARTIAPRREPWWRWTVWLACGITCKRIEEA